MHTKQLPPDNHKAPQMKQLPIVTASPPYGVGWCCRRKRRWWCKEAFFVQHGDVLEAEVATFFSMKYEGLESGLIFFRKETLLKREQSQGCLFFS